MREATAGRTEPAVALTVQAFTAQAALTPEAVAVRSTLAGTFRPGGPGERGAAGAEAAESAAGARADAGATLTFAELDAASDRLAHLLAGTGSGTKTGSGASGQAGATVALALPRTADMVVALLAVLKAGLVCQPLDLGRPTAGPWPSWRTPGLSPSSAPPRRWPRSRRTASPPSHSTSPPRPTPSPAVQPGRSHRAGPR
ncbi:hypothetical protein SCYAM73S_08649 [Streptomyces cyaneofuscatus]